MWSAVRNGCVREVVSEDIISVCIRDLLEVCVWFGGRVQSQPVLC